MAHYVEGSNKGFKAGADLSTNQYNIVKLNSSGNVILATAATDKIIGVLNDKPRANGTGDVRLRSAAGTLNVKLGGTVALGDAVTTNASSVGITTTTAGDQILGYALEAGVSGQIIELLPSTAKV